MTTQVVLMNSLGIAIASDSAVTAGGRVLNNSEKLFELELPHKLAILTSHRATFMEVPWEVVFSAWSQSLDRPLPSVESYVDSLCKFLKTIIPSQGDLSKFEMNYLLSFYYGAGNVKQQIQDIFYKHFVPYYESILDPETLNRFMSNDEWDLNFQSQMSKLLEKDLLHKVLSEIHELIPARRERFSIPITGLTESQARIWIEKFWSLDEDDLFNQDFGTWPNVPNLKELISEIWSVYLVHADYDGDTDLNFVGYGVDDLFPSPAWVSFHGVVDGFLLKRTQGSAESSPAARSAFFGQTDAIRSITRGEDNSLISTAVTTTRQQLSNIYDQLSEMPFDELESTREFIKRSIDSPTIEEEMRRVGSEERGTPFRRVIEMAPMMDLAELASQLVGIQAVAAAMQQDNPTVGGFIDVAIITHRRGFEWVRHKTHNFS